MSKALIVALALIGGLVVVFIFVIGLWTIVDFIVEAKDE